MMATTNRIGVVTRRVIIAATSRAGLTSSSVPLGAGRGGDVGVVGYGTLKKDCDAFTATALRPRRTFSTNRRTSNILNVSSDELFEIRERLRAFGCSSGTKNEDGTIYEDSVTLQDASKVDGFRPRTQTTSEEGNGDDTTSTTTTTTTTIGIDPGVAQILTLHNPRSRNALTGKMMAELADCVDYLEQNHELLTAVIVRGSSRFFCAGADLGVAKEHLMTPDGGRWMSALMIDTLARLRNLPVVTVSAVEGMAVGGGAELATATDYRVADPGVVVRFVHARMGVSPGWGGGTRLARLVGRQRALELLGTARPLNASQALEYGLVDTVVDAEATMEETLVHFLDRYVHAHPGVLHAAKRVVARADDIPGIVVGDDDESSSSFRHYKNAVQNEHEVFCSMWGGTANQDAINQQAAASKKNKKNK